MSRYNIFFQAEDGIRDIGVTGVQTCALPILNVRRPRTLTRRVTRAPRVARPYARRRLRSSRQMCSDSRLLRVVVAGERRGTAGAAPRSEEHTSELQSRQYLVCRLLLETKNGESLRDS